MLGGCNRWASRLHTLRLSCNKRLGVLSQANGAIEGVALDIPDQGESPHQDQ
jgi:hypothetical protein